MRRQGSTYKEIQRSLGVSARRLRRVLNEQAPYLSGRQDGWRKRDAELIVDLRRRGLTYSEIGEEAGVSAPVIRKVLGEHAPELLRRRDGKRKLEPERVFVLRERGLSTYELGKMFGVSHTTIRNLLKVRRPDLLGVGREVVQRDVVDLRKLGLGIDEIVKATGLSQASVDKIFKRESLPRLLPVDIGLTERETAEDECLQRILEVGTRGRARDFAREYMRIKGWADKGLSVSQVARKLGKNPSVVYRYKKRFGIEFDVGE